VPPINKYIIDRENGFLVNNEPSAWANKIEELITNEDLRNKVSSNSIEYIRNNYDPNRNVDFYVDHFKKIIE